jgi:hypothetical protein
MTTSDYAPPVSKLLTLGDPREMEPWPSYRALGLGLEHVPELIRMALDEDLHWGDSDGDEIWAPIHAWRALGQLRAEDAVEPLTRLLAWIDEYGDDWVIEELPKVFGLIGPSAIPTLADYLDDDEQGLFARTTASDSLKEIAERHPEVRDDCIAAITETLERFEDLNRELNASLVWTLADLRAAETAPLVERAFAADQVEEGIVGRWEDIQASLSRPGREDLEPRPTKLDRQTAQRHLDELGRNDPCWCGSGKKYKYCHLRDDQQTVRG